MVERQSHSEVDKKKKKKILDNLHIDSDIFKTLPVEQVKKVVHDILPVSREDI